MGHITTDHLTQIRITIPSIKIAKLYGEKVYPIYEKYLTCSEEIQQPAALRDFLLPMLMNEQVKVVRKIIGGSRNVYKKDSLTGL